MTSMIARDTISQDLFDFRRSFDQVFNRFLNWPSMQEEHLSSAGFAPAVESYIDKDGKKFHCQIMLPGIDPSDVDIQVHGDALTISGERTNSREINEANFLRREVTYGSFQRTLPLPEGVDKDKLSAEYRNGVLEITAPMAAAALPRKIEVKSLPIAKHATA